MTIEGFVTHYGLLGLFLGAGVEGEAVVVTGGVLAQRHLVPLWGAMLAAATGSCLVDQFWFFLGRYCRRYRWVGAILHKPAAQRAVGMFGRHPKSFVFGFRFVYGFRTVSPIVIGASDVPTRTFLWVNGLAAAIWGPLFTLVGYAFGKAAEAMLAHVQSAGPYLLAGIAILAAAIGIGIGIVAWRRRGRNRLEPLLDGVSGGGTGAPGVEQAAFSQAGQQHGDIGG